MPIDFLTELEQKVDSILKNSAELGEENKRINQELQEKNECIAKLEEAQQQLRAELESQKLHNGTNDSKLKAVTDKIQGLLAKIEAV